MRREGKLADWNDEKGFGFVRNDENRERVFAHIRDFDGGQRRPVNGDRLSFVMAQDKQGRPCATSIRILPETPAMPGASLWAGAGMTATEDSAPVDAGPKTLAAGMTCGLITEWNDERGFGFVTPDAGGANIFLHIKAMARGQRRPACGYRVTCRTVADGKGGLKAEEARLDLPLSARLTGIPPAVLCAVTFLLALTGLILAGRLPLWLGGFFALASLTTFAAYALDKSAARNNRWRTQESTLLLLGLVGGWPGAIAAQQILRHKSVKTAFRRLFWLTVAGNIFLCGVYLQSVPG